MQDVWLAVCEGSVQLPDDIREARLALFIVTRRIAQRARRHAMSNAYRHVPEPDNYVDDFDEQHAANALAVFEAIERLVAPQRELVREYHVYGYTIKEMAERAGISEDAMEKRVWRASAELEYQRQKDEKLEEDRKKKAMVIAPLVLDIDRETRAAFCAIWDAEGRSPEFGGAPPPTSGAPVVPPIIPVAPIISTVTRSIVVAVGFVVLLVSLVLVPMGIMALNYFWSSPHANTARTGLRVLPIPSVAEIKDVDEVVPAYPISAISESPVAPTASAIAAKPARGSSIPLKKDTPEATNGPLLERVTGD
jgi:DNA-directed RNA polymerase specialized sigma24 family protein